mmetsp:Transcript_4454/g.9743  ORF Transcript_4454/g.9743 Transcript_4454/m.9743 type:complete len:437 (-) Transcript_4454:181-1491(-)
MPLDVVSQRQLLSLGSNFCPVSQARASGTGRHACRPKLARGKWCTDAFGRHCPETHGRSAEAASTALVASILGLRLGAIRLLSRRRHWSQSHQRRLIDVPARRHRRGAYDWSVICKPFLMLVYLVNDASMYIVGDLATHEYMKQTVLFSSAIVSLTVGYLSTWYRRGWSAVRECADPMGIIRLLPISICFFLSNLAQLNAFRYFDGTFIKLFGQTKLPLTALLSYILLHRRYALQQWLTMAMLTVSCTAFTVMRLGVGGVSMSDTVNPLGLFFVLMWVVLNVIGTLQAERAFKGKPEMPFTTVMMRLHAGKLLASGTWLCFMPAFSLRSFFVGWDSTTVLVLFTLLFDAWLSGAMVKTLSSVTKSVVKCASLVLLYIVGLSTGRQGFNLPEMLTGVTIVLQTLLFATLSPALARREHESDREAGQFSSAGRRRHRP